MNDASTTTNNAAAAKRTPTTRLQQRRQALERPSRLLPLPLLRPLAPPSLLLPKFPRDFRRRPSRPAPLRHRQHYRLKRWCVQCQLCAPPACGASGNGSLSKSRPPKRFGSFCILSTRIIRFAFVLPPRPRKYLPSWFNQS